MPTKNEDLAKEIYWYKDAVIYELHIKAFADSNQDGIGDFKGLLGKLDYLTELGVTAIWLLPFYPSPLKDDGYDISDYYTINPTFGHLDDFKELLVEAHNRNLKVITELVLNHTSDKHPWFQRARKAPKDSEHRNYYVWSDDPLKYPDVRIIFQDFETSNWTWDPEAKQYFWHRFFSHQPDLNYDNPNVQEEVLRIIDYWCNLGVDGFRLDAIPYLFEREHTNGENLPETHAFLKKVRKYVDDKYPGTILLAEANMWPEDSASYFGEGDECHMNYHFPLMPRMYMALQMENRYPIIDIFEQTPDIPESCQWGIFLRNHDELTLEMVTDEERDYMYRVYVKDPKARINLGIRHRLAPLMNNNRKKIELLNALLFSLPGTPVLYYGDEIGMGDNFYLGDRNGVRTPMQWSPGRNAGFSEANPHKLYLPLIQDIDYHYESLNVEIQNRNPSSLLWWMKRIIAKRKQYKSFGWGDIKFLASDNSKIFAFTRTYKEETMLVVANLSRHSQPATLALENYAGQTPVEVFSKNKFPTIKSDQHYFLSLSGYECQWFQLEKQSSNPILQQNLDGVNLKDWESIVEKNNLYKLERTFLPTYLTERRWFSGKSRTVEQIKVVKHGVVPLKDYSTIILLLEVTYNDGLPEYYQIPISFAEQKDSLPIIESYPQAIIAKISVGGVDGVLYDAIYGSPFQCSILQNMVHNKSIFQHDKGVLLFKSRNLMDDLSIIGEKVKPRIHFGEQSNTSILYGTSFFLKLYRKLDYVTNADVEITKFLTDESSFNHIPKFIGTIEWQTSQDDGIVLGMMQELVQNSEDGWTYMLDILDEMNEKLLASPELLKIAEEITLDNNNNVQGDSIHPALQEFFSGAIIEQVRMLGVRTAEMHIALGARDDIQAFSPEPYSLHYQRSLYSGLKSLVRNTLYDQRENIKTLSPELQTEVEEILKLENKILETLKDIYKNKIDVTKIRIHGDFHLGQVLFTGKEFIITDFEGEPARSYTERRIKRSPLRDVAGMIRSFHYAAYATLLLDTHIRKDDFKKLMPIMETWHRYISGIYLNAYKDAAKDTSFVPKSDEELNILMKTFLLEKALYEINYELNNRPEWVVIPLNGIKAIMSNGGEFITLHEGTLTNGVGHFHHAKQTTG